MVQTNQVDRRNRKKVRQEEAAERQAASDKLTSRERLERLDARFGRDKGAKKERMKLLSKL
jgi:hypothetical protein